MKNSLWKGLVSFRQIVDSQTVLITLLSCISTFLCISFDFKANLPTGLIGVAIIFPIVFSINAAYKRREEALKYFSSLLGSLSALYYGHRDWISAKADTTEHANRCLTLIEKLLRAIKNALTERDPKNITYAQDVYALFSELSLSMEKLREAGLPGNEASRLNSYLRSIMVEFERARNIHAYRTPLSLRAYSVLFLNMFPIIFGPYFAYLSETNVLIGFAVAILYSTILVSLDNIQEDLEDPFDGIGEDDIRLDLSEERRLLLSKE